MENQQEEGLAQGFAAVAGEGVTKSDESVGEKRRGFHPILVMATIVTVIFVLWFCPWVLMRARIAANEQAAESVLKSDKALLLKMPPEQLKKMLGGSKLGKELADLRLLLNNYTIIQDDQSHTGQRMILLYPSYYARSAIKSYCLSGGKILWKDLAPEEIVQLKSSPDSSWQMIN